MKTFKLSLLIVVLLSIAYVMTNCDPLESSETEKVELITPQQVENRR